MKKLFLSSLILFFFSVSIILFQFSCRREAQAQPSNYVLTPATTTALGGVIVGNGLNITSAGVLSVGSSNTTSINLLIYVKVVGSIEEIWTAKHDGTNQTKVNMTLPANTKLSDDFSPLLSPDGKKVFFGLNSTISGQNGTDLYSANIDGSGVTKVIDKGGNGNYVLLGGVY